MNWQRIGKQFISKNRQLKYIKNNPFLNFYEKLKNIFKKIKYLN